MPWYNAATNSYEGSGTLGARNYESASSASSNAASSAMGGSVAAFTGTNTGNRYNVGQSYVMNGDRYVAMADGSFQNQRTGQALEGSSNSPNVTFHAAQTLASSGGGSGAGSAHVLAGAAAARGAGPGLRGASVAGQLTTGAGASGVGVATPAGPGAARGGFVTQVIGPLKVVLDRSFPDVADFWENRYGELGEWIGGVVNVTADVAANDETGNLDRMAEQLIRENIRIAPGSVADNVIRFVQEAPSKNWLPTTNPFEDARLRDETAGPGMLTTPNYGY